MNSPASWHPPNPNTVNQMSITSKIEWTNSSWNPFRGCTKISPGCVNCYAHTFAERWRGVPGHAYERGFEPRPVPERLGDPLRWAKPRTIFVNSMSDLFHEKANDDFIAQVAEVMLAADWHTFQVLTKRPERMVRLLKGPLKTAAKAKHILWGVTVENRKHGVPRIAMLRSSGARNTFVSIEPLLEDLGEIDLRGISWVIVGGESGPGARPMDESWVRTVRRQCRAHDVPFFFKQWGGVHKKLAGRLLDGRSYDELPEIETNPVPPLARRREIITRILGDTPPWTN
jgi:protein gp37